MSKRQTGKRKNDLTHNLNDEEKSKQTLSSKLATIDKNTEKKAKKEEINYRFWIMKSEPESRIENGFEMKFGVEDLKASKDQITHWDGVRNYEARNHMKAMKFGQQAFFYHSNCKNPGIVALMTICKESYPDFTAFDKNDPHYDSKSDKNNPKWFMVDVKFDRDLKRFISLNELKQYHLMHKKSGGPLANLSLFTRSRLSVQGLNDEEWNFIIDLENKPALKP